MNGHPPGKTRVAADDGTEIAVHELGGSGLPVVFSHATGFHGLVWKPVTDRLGGQVRAISLDHRGHGDSTALPHENFDWKGFGRDVLAVIDGLHLDKPVGVGHSAGGTAMLLAEQARPGTFRSLYLYEPVIVPVDPPLGRDTGNWLAEGARRRRDVFPSREQAYSTYSSKPPFERWDAEALSAYINYGLVDRPDGTVALKCRPEDEAAIYEMATDSDCYAGLSRVGCSATIAVGAVSEFAAVGNTIDAVTGRLAHGRFQVLAGLSHFGPMEDPAEVAASIRQFLAPGRCASPAQ